MESKKSTHEEKVEAASAAKPSPLVNKGLVAITLIFIGLLSYVSLSRLFFPYDLEWMEGGMLTHSLRILEGKPIFAEPSVDFIAYIYQPLYAYVVAGLGILFGLTPGIARALSLTAAVLTGLLIARIVYLETGDRILAWTALGLAASLYPITGYWYDLVRVDSLFLLLIVSGLFIAAYRVGGRSAWLWSSILLVGAYFTKQVAVLFSPIAFLLFLKHRRVEALSFALIQVFLINIVTYLANVRSDGWYTYYVHVLVGGEPYDRHRILIGIWIEMFRHYPIILGLTFWAVIGLLKRLSRNGVLGALTSDPWLPASMCGLVSAIVTWCRPGGFDNNFLPFYLLAIVPALRRVHELETQSGFSYPNAPRIGVLLQLALTLYDPRPKIPAPIQWEAGDALIRFIANEPGPVLIPDHPFYAHMAGKDPSYQSMALWDLWFREGDEAFPSDLLKAIESKAYSAVITSWPAERPSPGTYPPNLTRYYHKTHLTPYAGVFGPIMGAGANPTFVYRPIAAGWRALGLSLDFESGSYSGWYPNGIDHAFGKHPLNPNDAPGGTVIRGTTGRGLASSLGGTEGTLMSRWFILDADAIRFSVAGGRDPEKVSVQLRIDGQLVRATAGQGDTHLRPHTWDVRAFKGRPVQLRLVDKSSAPDDFLLADDFAFVSASDPESPSEANAHP